MKRILISRPGLLAAIWSAVIMGMCATPGRFIPAAGWMELLSLDKLIHALVFFILTFLLWLATFRASLTGGFRALALSGAIVYGALLEWMQAHIFSERSSDIYDVIANSAGCLIAAAFSKKIKAFYFTSF